MIQALNLQQLSMRKNWNKAFLRRTKKKNRIKKEQDLKKGKASDWSPSPGLPFIYKGGKCPPPAWIVTFKACLWWRCHGNHCLNCHDLVGDCPAPLPRGLLHSSAPCWAHYTTSVYCNNPPAEVLLQLVWFCLSVLKKISSSSTNTCVTLRVCQTWPLFDFVC